ncbi:oxidoreductase [Kutzneria buriramensis]|uniref:Aryl-alcohol dehydrogenase-like predicted oxidoreductase n=1 Tax=Kutzneria buriramensis TaxID=1045776 RepID=A0A3E0I9N8_9PSEU|nr:oxidoreductase [Kutzneria buriramensis]REH55321.1 aryl-alcohol dehydrogenase-like predicted oxidoreductase [Kutzneria buriramensis]
MTSNISATKSGHWDLGGRQVARVGYGTMQLTGPGVMGPPKDRAEAVAVLRRAVELGVNHIDTSDYYGPYVANEILREALHPYADDLVLVTKVGALRTPDGGWPEALSPDELRQAVHDNLTRLGVEQIDVVNLRMPGFAAPEPRSLEEPFTVLAELKEQGLIGHLGVSNVTADQLAEAQRIAPVVCVQNLYNIANRQDEQLVRSCDDQGIAYVPFFPLGGFQLVDDPRIKAVADRHNATVPQVALAWLLQRSPNLLAIPGTSSLAHLEENIAGASLRLSDDDVTALEPVAA